MHCKNCDVLLEKNARFCPQCATPVIRAGGSLARVTPKRETPQAAPNQSDSQLLNNPIASNLSSRAWRWVLVLLLLALGAIPLLGVPFAFIAVLFIGKRWLRGSLDRRSSSSMPKIGSWKAALLVATVVLIWQTYSITSLNAGRDSSTALQTLSIPPNSAGGIGTRIESNGLALTAVRIRKFPLIDRATVAYGDQTFLFVGVIFENVSWSSVGVSQQDFKLRSADGTAYSPTVRDSSYVTDTQMLQSIDLAAGEKARGEVAFLVPSSQSGFVLILQKASVFGGNAVLQATLN